MHKCISISCKFYFRINVENNSAITIHTLIAIVVVIKACVTLCFVILCGKLTNLSICMVNAQ